MKSDCSLKLQREREALNDIREREREREREKKKKLGLCNTTSVPKSKMF